MNKKLMTGILLLGTWGFSAGRLPAQAAASNSQSTASSSSDAQDTKALEDQDIALLRRDIGAKKKQLIAANLTLTTDEATKFWPVYDQYTADLKKINNAKYEVIKDYANSWGNITDAQALDLTKRALDVDRQAAELRLRYVPQFAKVLPGKKVATFLQIERRVQGMIELQLTSSLPLVQDQPAQQ
jgi:hypothetical protein